jgi:hypothetical protein
MQSRFLPAFLFLALLWSTHLNAQNQDSINIDGIVGPTCGCDGFIDISVTSNSPSQPPGFFFYAWSNGSTSQDLFSICPGTYCVTVTNGNAQGSTAVKCFTVQNIPFDPIKIISSNPAAYPMSAKKLVPELLSPIPSVFQSSEAEPIPPFFHGRYQGPAVG